MAYVCDFGKQKCCEDLFDVSVFKKYPSSGKAMLKYFVSRGKQMAVYLSHVGQARAVWLGKNSVAALAHTRSTNYLAQPRIPGHSIRFIT